MKTIVKIFVALIVLIIIAAIALPFLFKGKLSELAREEINKNLNAEVGFDDFSLTLFKSFPDFTLGVSGLSITGAGAFEGDTLAYIPSIDITVDLFSVIKGSTYQVKKIKVDSPSIVVKILEDGTANYDIALETEEDPASVSEDVPGESNYTLSLKKLEINDAYINYTDASTDMRASMLGTDFVLSGDLTADQTLLKTTIDVGKLSLVYGGIPYFSNTHMTYKADIDADLANEIYTLKKNSLSLNQLFLVFDGSVSMVNDDLNIIMAFNAPVTDFKHFLSLIPALYTRDFEGLEATGKLGVDGHIKGVYSEEQLPAFNVNIAVEKGMFKYTSLPQAVSNVGLKASISNPGGDVDNTLIDLAALHMKMGNNPIDVKLMVRTPVSDPDLDGTVKGKIDLATIKEFYPLQPGEELKGNILADITLKGKLSAIENENYESFTAIGSLLMQNLEYNSDYTGKPLEVSNAQLNFSPQYLDLVSFTGKIGENDIMASGKISSYLAYLFNDGTLTGILTTRSKYLNLNTLMPEEDQAGTDGPAATDSTAMSVIEVPGNIDFQLNSTFDKLIYDQYEMENVNGKLGIKDKRLTIKNLSMNILDGEMVVSGEYNAADLDRPEFDFDLNISNIDIQKAYNTFGAMEKFAPIANKTRGTFSSRLSMRSVLDQEMMPLYETMTGGGKIETSTLQVKDINTLDKIADALKYEPIRNLSIDRILLLFEFVDGKILVEPFDIKNQNFTGKMAGWTGLDQSINYTLNLNIPRASFGKEANNLLDNLVDQANSKGANVSLGETVSLDVLIGGTLTNPEIKTNLKESGKNLVQEVKKQVDDEIKKQKEELSKQAREEAKKILDDAEKQAQKLKNEARKQAENVRKSAADAAKKIRNEAEKQAKNVEKEGKEKGFLAEAAAKEAAKQIRKEAEKQAKNLESEADRQAKSIVENADKQAAQIMDNAQKEADKILGKI
jgi:vacuolar-type H+-ATPase subunit H